jgi:hypothetical protein
MNTVVIEQVAINDLPTAWRAQLNMARNTRVTVRIEEEGGEEIAQAAPIALTNNPLFGMWQDREDMGNVAAYARGLRAPQFNVDGSRCEG